MASVGEICRKHGPAYVTKYGGSMPFRQRKVLRRLSVCRTGAAGGHVIECVSCGQWHYRFHSCGDRNCPGCGGLAAANWYHQQQKKLLNAPYFQLVFTLPSALRRIVRSNQKVLLPILMKSVNAAIQTLAADPDIIGGQLGVIAVLHTWGRTLVYHPHVHCLIPAIAADPDGNLILINGKFLLPTRPLAVLFRAKFMQAARAALPNLEFPQTLWDKQWYVHAQRALAPRLVLKYLAGYLYRTAISNGRVLAVTDQSVTFAYTDHNDGKHKTTTVSAEEFLRRFLQHVLPKGMHRVRYYGLINPKARDRLDALRQQLAKTPHPAGDPVSDDDQEQEPEWLPQCPHCGSTDLLIIIADFPPITRGPPPPLPVMPRGNP